MKETIQEHFGYFVKEHPEVNEAYSSFVKAVRVEGPLDEKSIALIKISASATNKNHFALMSHIHKALRAGVSEQEIEQCILLIAPTTGFPTMMEALLIMRQAFEEAK